MNGIAAFLLSLSLLTADKAENSSEVKFVANAAPSGAKLTLHHSTNSGSVGSPVFAHVLRAGDTLTLIPTYPLSPGETYEARVTTGDGKISDRKIYHHPAPEAAAPKIIQILPNTGRVPANLLKFYLEFDQPMREGIEIFDKIHLLDLSTQKRVDSPWRQQDQWSHDGKRLTLLIHPGRIKQGVNLRTELGPVLIPNRKYELILNETIQTPDGRKLGKSFHHTFETTAEDRTLLDPGKWKIEPPEAPHSPLMINTQKALDPWLVTRHLMVIQDENEIATTLKWDRSQTRFELTPTSPWLSGDFTIKIDEFLEDLSGNTALRSFDTDLSRDSPPKNPTLELHFTVPTSDKPANQPSTIP